MRSMIGIHSTSMLPLGDKSGFSDPIPARMTVFFWSKGFWRTIYPKSGFFFKSGVSAIIGKR